MGRAAELRELDLLLERASSGSDGVVAVIGPQGSGKTALLTEAADRARRLGFQVVGGSAPAGLPGGVVWAQLLREVGASERQTAVLLTHPSPIEMGIALRPLATGPRRLIVIDDLDRGGPEAVELLALLAARLVLGSTAVVVAAGAPLQVGRQLRLGGLVEPELAAAIGLPDSQRVAIWMASRGMPGIARTLAAQLLELPEHRAPLVQLALQAPPTTEFLVVDGDLIRLVEGALEQAPDPNDRARLLARLARELLGDPLAGPRRRALVNEALTVARSGGDGRIIAEVLDARLHALWDPPGAQDRLAAASEITDLAVAAGDQVAQRNGLFWRFVALMELARVDEAEGTLIAFERAATSAGDAAGCVMATSRHAMLAGLRGRFDVASALGRQVAEQARRIGLPDANRLPGAVTAVVAIECTEETGWQAVVDDFYAIARRLPGHLYEATAARILAGLGRWADAAAELDRLLPRAVTASGPRWVGAMTDLAVVAAETGNREAAARLYRALLPYRHRLVVWGGAVTVTGPVAHYLGLLAAAVGDADSAVSHLREALSIEERVTALPALAHSLATFGDALTLRGGAGDAQQASDSRRRAHELADRLGMTVLLGRLVPPVDEWTLRRDGTGWLLEAGPERVRMADSQGLRHLRALLAVPPTRHPRGGSRRRRDGPALSRIGAGPGRAGRHRLPQAPQRSGRGARFRGRRRGRPARGPGRRRTSVAARRAPASHRAGRPVPPRLLRVGTGAGERHPDVAVSAGPHRRRRTPGRRAPAGLDPHRPGLPVRPGSGRPHPLAGVSERIVPCR